MNDMVSISFCPTGMVPKRADSKYVPLSPVEIANDVNLVSRLGITSVHLHARDQQENPSTEIKYFKEIILRIREINPELVICVTTSGRVEKEFEKRSAVLYLDGDCKPDMASLTLSSLNFAKSPSENSPELIKNLVALMNERGIKPECEIFDFGMLNYMHYLISKSLLKPPFVVNFILGNVAGAQADLSTLGLMVQKLPQNSLWHVGGIGSQQLTGNVLAMVAGGSVRIGLEDNLFLKNDRSELASNYQLVERIHKIAELLGKSIMSPRELRKFLLNKELSDV